MLNIKALSFYNSNRLVFHHLYRTCTLHIASVATCVEVEEIGARWSPIGRRVPTVFIKADIVLGIYQRTPTVVYMECVVRISQSVNKTMYHKLVVYSVSIGRDDCRELKEILNQHNGRFRTVTTDHQVSFLVIVFGTRNKTHMIVVRCQRRLPGI